MLQIVIWVHLDVDGNVWLVWDLRCGDFALALDLSLAGGHVQLSKYCELRSMLYS